MKNIDAEFANSNEFNIYELYQALTLDTICRTGMGVDFGIQKDIKNSKILDASRVIFTNKFNLLGVIISELIRNDEGCSVSIRFGIS